MEAISSKVLEMAHLHASLINGFSICVDMHWWNLKRSNETDEHSLPWRPGGMRPTLPMLKRAAPALTEAVTRLSDRSDPVPDEIGDETARQFEEPALAALVLDIAMVNLKSSERGNAASCRRMAQVWRGEGLGGKRRGCTLAA
jgi:AhpD family alkylhydroperoxidase